MDERYMSDLYNEIKANSNIVNGDEYRALVTTIAQYASDTVVKTLGPYGSTTMIDEGSGFTYPTKDGWSCLSRLQFTDPIYNTIFNMLKKISFNSVTSVGDGTTTAMVAANYFLKSLYNDFLNKLDTEKTPFRQADFVDTMYGVYEDIERSLKNNKFIKRVDVEGDFSDIYKIAYIATNGNEQFSKIIQRIYQETKNPNIQITLDPSIPETTYAIQHGYKFESHVLNYNAYVNNDDHTIAYKNEPRRVVIFNHNVTFQAHEKIIGGLMGMTNRDHYELIIMAPYFDDIVTSWINSQVQNLIQNHQIPSLMLVQIPTTMNIHRNILYDLTVLTNTQVFDESMVKAFNILYHNQTHGEDEQIKDDMFTMEQYAFESPEGVLQRCIGMVQSIVFDKNEAFLQDYETIANKKKYDELIREAKEDYESRKEKALKTVGGTLDKEFMFSQLRWIKLTGNTGVIKVGAMSDIQQRTDKDVLDDAVLACRSAYENGYVRGMNLEILSELSIRMKGLEQNRRTDSYEYIIYNMLYSAFYMTTMNVIMNKHPDVEKTRLISMVDGRKNENGELIETLSTKMSFGSVQLLDYIINDSNHYDYNLRTETCHDSNFWEVVNSTATDIEILRAVINVLTTIITSNQYISTTRRFDSKVIDSKTRSKRLSEDRLYVGNKVIAVLETLLSSKYYEVVRDLLTPDYVPIETASSKNESEEN